MSIRFAKQLIYGAFYVVFWVLVIGVGYVLFFRPAPSAPPAPALTAQPIAVLGMNVFATSPGHDTFLAKVENTNADLAAQYFQFSFDLTNASGTVVQSLPGASFLYGSEVKYITLVNEAIVSSSADGSAPAANWILTLPTSSVAWVASSSFGRAPAFVVQNVSTAISSSSAGNASGTLQVGTALASGQLVNNDTATFTNIFIVAVFKDANGNPVAASQTELDSIAPGQTENFSVSYPAVPGLDPALTEVDAYAAR